MFFPYYSAGNQYTTIMCHSESKHSMNKLDVYIVFKYDSLAPPPAVEVPVTSNERRQSYMCALGVSIVYPSTIFRLNFVFRTVLFDLFNFQFLITRLVCSNVANFTRQSFSVS